MSTKIEWCDETWNPVTGCTAVSPGCRHCYAERMSQRLAGRFGYPEDDPFTPGTFHEDKLNQPTKWKKPRRIFVCSMGDLFHEDVPGSVINQVWMQAFNNPRHTFIFLTKRPERMARWTAKQEINQRSEVWPAHMWIGVTAENQARANERIPILLSTPATVRFVSIEPMLGPVDLSEIETVGDGFTDSIECLHWDKDLSDDTMHNGPIHWVICGGETGPGARPMDPDWTRGIRNQCVDAGVPFFFKKFNQKHCSGCYEDGDVCGGRMLDCHEWREFPNVL